MKINRFLKGRIGIYGIRNTVNNKIYVGQTQCMYRRCHQYLYDFKNRSIDHLNDYLYRAMKKNGIENFEFFPLEFCTVEQLRDREFYWITRLHSLDRNSGYNLRSDTETGMRTSLHTSLKISENLKRQWAAGERSGHSDKLKEKWKSDPDRRKRQGETFSKIRTKYEYTVTYEDGRILKNLLYAHLREMKLHNVMSNFHRKVSNGVTYKGLKIERFIRGEA